MNKEFSRILGVFLVLMVMVGMASAQAQGDSYIDALAKIRDQITQSETNIIKDVDSFQGAFQDAFKLIDDEISRLIFANAAMVGLVFAIMFLVYAKTSSRSRRDMQVLLVAHSKHMDNMISARLDEFARRMEMMFEERRKEQMSTLESLDDTMGSLASLERVDRRKKVEVPEVKNELVSTDIVAESVAVVEQVPQEKKRLFGFLGKKKHEAVIDDTDKNSEVNVLVPKKPSEPGNRFLKRIKRGLMRILGRNKHRENVEEFRLK